MQETPGSADALFAGIVGTLADRARAKGLELRVEAPGQLPPLLGDPPRLEEALLSFAANAYKFTDTGSVTLACRPDDESADSALIRF